MNNLTGQSVQIWQNTSAQLGFTLQACAQAAAAIGALPGVASAVVKGGLIEIFSATGVKGVVVCTNNGRGGGVINVRPTMTSAQSPARASLSAAAAPPLVQDGTIVTWEPFRGQCLGFEGTDIDTWVGGLTSGSITCPVYGPTVTRITDGTLDSLAQLKAGTILISTHGYLHADGTEWFDTAQPPLFDDQLPWLLGWVEAQYGQECPAYAVMAFNAKYAISKLPPLNGAIVYAAACDSAAGQPGDMGSAFLTMGASVYMGFTDSVTQPESQAVATDMLAGLAAGLSLSAARNGFVTDSSFYVAGGDSARYFCDADEACDGSARTCGCGIDYATCGGICGTLAPTSCIGDCNGDGVVTVDEQLVLCAIALGKQPATACAAGANSEVDVAQLLQACCNGLNGCPP